MKIINKTKNTVLAQETIIADRFLKRLKGLLGRERLEEGRAMLIRPCDSIHTFFMRFPIDVLFVNKENRVIGLKKSIPPWRSTRIYWTAEFTIELSAGVIDATMTSVGDEISLT